MKVFLGITAFYRRFIPRYATIAAPLTSVLAGEQKFQWSTHCQDAFNTLKRKLSTAPILAHPVADKPFVLTTDASTVGIGAELAQEISEGLRRLHILVEFYLRQRDDTLHMIENFLQSLWQLVTFDTICLEQIFAAD